MEYDKLYREWRDQSLQTWTQMMNPEACVQAVGASTDAFLAGQRKVLEATQNMLDASEVPNRQDVERLQRLVSLAEARAQAAEERLEQAVQGTATLEAGLQAANRALEASQARLVQLEIHIAAWESAPAAEPPAPIRLAPPKPRRKKG